MLTTKELLMSYGEERECIKPKAGDANLWIKIWEELLSLGARGMTVEVEHVKGQKKRMICRTLRSWQKQEQCWTKGLCRK